MAKWGEGDPRWIVEERPDATNVNNWHWCEKNATHWSKERLIQLLTGTKIKQDRFECDIYKVDECYGEATVNNRKGKLIYFYEWRLVLIWTGIILDSDSEVDHKGRITIPNLSEENDVDEIEITISIDKSNDESETLKEFMYNVGRDVVRKKLELYIKELKEEYSKNLILPLKGEVTEDGSPKVKQPSSGSATDSNLLKSLNAVTVSDSQKSDVGCKLDVKTLTMTVEFNCTANDLYNTLLRDNLVALFSGAPAKIDATRGGAFWIYGGNIYGKFEQLVPERRIKQTWRLKNWPSGHFSEVTMDFEQNRSSTQLKLTQTGIPASEFDGMHDNWHRYYWQSIIRKFGFGSTLADIL